MNKNSSRGFLAAFIGAASFFTLGIHTSRAGSATWSGAVSGDWNNSNNWQEMTFPNGLLETATFGDSAQAAVFISSPVTVLGVTFEPTVTSYTINVGSTGLTFSGAVPGIGGIENNSGVAQNFVVSSAGIQQGGIVFTNDATAGSSPNTIFTCDGGGGLAISGGTTNFIHRASAGSATFILNSQTGGGGGGGNVNFIDTTTADHGTFTVNGNGHMMFVDSSTAANGTFTVNGNTGPGSGNPGSVVFTNDGTPTDGNSTPGNATFTNNGRRGRQLTGRHRGNRFYSGKCHLYEQRRHSQQCRWRSDEIFRQCDRPPGHLY